MENMYVNVPDPLKGKNNTIVKLLMVVLNPYRGFVCVGVLYSTGFTSGYSYSIPSGLC